jgi:oligopeptide transport system substrate-binding protein
MAWRDDVAGVWGRSRPWAMGLVAALCAAACSQPWNDPYPPAQANANILYSSFSERPKHLDPARSYSADEYAIIAQIYEPPLQYHYLKRPYTLIPLAATQVPQPTYLDSQGHTLPENALDDKIAYSVYEIHIKKGVMYQPHPAFARDGNGAYRYLHMARDDLARVHALGDFKYTGTRELVADDFVYEIKRLADPRLHSPIFGLMSGYIVGLDDLAKTLQKAYAEASHAASDEDVYLDLNRYPLAGATVVDRYTYRIVINGKYPQFRYWLAMPFFAPLPPEADRFYAQPGMAEKNISPDWYPVGTGPYMLTVNNPNMQMVLTRNPNFHGETYPAEGAPGDAAHGLLKDAGKPLPFVDKVVYRLEKESIPRWNKFLQGYYDNSGIGSDSFDQAIRISAAGEATLSDAMKEKGIQLATAVAASTYYTGFNMLDPVVGGDSERARKLRLALSIAVDQEEYISIFLNGRGIAAQGPIPPGIFGHENGKAGINPYVYNWVDGRPQRKSIAEARRLLAEAGYPDGRDAKTGQPLLLHFDTALSGPEAKATLDWLRKQFEKLNIQLDVRSTDYNRFQDKMQNGNAQIFQWGWNADYPDPENFLFLLYGPNKKVGNNGENAANYDNPEFNRLFEQMKNMDNGPRRQAIIDSMLDIARHDAPWMWGFHPKSYSLHHAWVYNAMPNLMANNTLKYLRIDPQLRAVKRAEWNKPVLWPLAFLAVLAAAVIVPAVVSYLRRERRPLRTRATV